MDSTEQNDFIVTIFKTVKKVEQNRYRKGQSIRQIIMAKQKNGEEVENYRIEFLKDSVFKLFKFMEEIGTDFNKNHPDDRFTAADIGDVLVNAINILENKVPD